MDMASARGGLPALWSSEQPAVYHLVVSLVRSGDGAVIDAESCQVRLSVSPTAAVTAVGVASAECRDVNSTPVCDRLGCD